MSDSKTVYGWSYVLKIKGRKNRVSLVYPEARDAWAAGIKEWEHFERMDFHCHLRVELRNGKRAMAKELY